MKVLEGYEIVSRCCNRREGGYRRIRRVVSLSIRRQYCECECVWSGGGLTVGRNVLEVFEQKRRSAKFEVRVGKWWSVRRARQDPHFP